MGRFPICNVFVTKSVLVAASECDDVNMESSDYDSDWPLIPNTIPSLQPYTLDPDDRTTVQDMISKR